MGAILLIVILYLLFGLMILAIRYWPVTLAILALGGGIWFGRPWILLAIDLLVIRFHAVLAKLRLRGLSRMATTALMARLP
jgi:hypothetical protein